MGGGFRPPREMAVEMGLIDENEFGKHRLCRGRAKVDRIGGVHG